MKKSTISKIKVQKLSITARTKKKSPKYVEDQEKRAKSGLRKISEKTRDKILVVYHETYVTFHPLQLPGRKFVHAVDHTQLEFEEKFKFHTKFPKKYMVWQALDEFGNVLDAYISDGITSSSVYIEKCIKGKLIPLINKHDNPDDVLF